MNRVRRRASMLILLILFFGAGMCLFLGKYFAQGKNWVLHTGSPHVYTSQGIQKSVVTDRENVLLLDLRDGRAYAQDADLRTAFLHWVGDRQGNISTRILNAHGEDSTGFNPVSGVHSYGDNTRQLLLTCHAELQLAAMEAMGDYHGTVAVYNYKTGEILCAVSTPDFDPDNVPDIANDETGAYDGAYVNRFLQSTYTPGSIFKIVTVAAALERMPELEQETFTCTGVQEYGIDKVTCESAHGTLTFQEAFSHSCNCAFAQIADRLGGEVLAECAEKFGITSPVSFDGCTSAAGSLDCVDAAPVQVAWSAIGQHKDLVNPCRYLTFVGAIAGGGQAVTPHIISEIRVGSKSVYTAAPETEERILSPETAQKIREYMRINVADYYGAESFPGLTVCAKTGTAEVGGEKKPNAMFTGFVLDEEYPLAFFVAVEDGGYGRQVCVPVISKVLAACKQVLDEE